MESHIIQPARANKKVTDLGVLGLAHTKAALDAKFGPPVAPTMEVAARDGEDFTSSSWGKETPEEIEKKGELFTYMLPRRGRIQGRVCTLTCDFLIRSEICPRL